MDVPLDTRHKLGRIYGNDWAIANVAKLLRFSAGQGSLRAGALTGSTREINQNYLRMTSARHLPSGVAVSLQRDERGNWHAEIAFAGLDSYLPWDDAVAEQWLSALFLEERARVQESIEEAAPSGSVRRFVLTG